MEDDISIRSMNREELGTAVEWAAREGWNPGLNDADAFFAADPEGWFLAERAGEIIGTVSSVAYGPEFGFVGFYIVKPEYRGHRVGWLLGEMARRRQGDRNIGIDGVLAKQDQYAKFFGFKFAYRNRRFGGRVDVAATADGVVALEDLAFADVAAFDRQHFPASREVFLRKWITMPNSRALAVVDDSGIRGYGVIRQCREGFKIGPLFAHGPAVAQTLFHALCRFAVGEQVFLDVPEVNSAAVAMAELHGMSEVFATARMYNHGIPDLPLDRIYGVTTFELG